MAKINLEGLRHSYRPDPKTDDDWALKQLDIEWSDGPVDFVTAHKWFNLAALKGNMDAREYRKELSDEMTKSQVAEAQKLAREWLRTH